jgi:hypothetical protein
MIHLDILERDGDYVLWRYKGMDGTSAIRDGSVKDSELCTAEIMLRSDVRAQISREVRDWLLDSGDRVDHSASYPYVTNDPKF